MKMQSSSSPRKFSFNDLVLTPDSPKIPYHRRSDESKKAIHWGQRKLLISEIEFFTLHWDRELIPSPICVYAGSAPGIHIPFLSSLFPDIEFHLYDPARFEIKETDKIKLFNQYFTDDVAKHYSGRNDIFFISDIRTSNNRAKFLDLLEKNGYNKFDRHGNPIGPRYVLDKLEREANILNEDQIWGDMNMQQQWVLLMNPEHALLKFRLPYSFDGSERKLKYLTGIVYWQVWPGPTSTEARLKPVKNSQGKYELGNWSNLEYEQWGFYHNTVEREQFFYLNPFFNNTDAIDYPELLNDYDSTAEAYILSLYATSQGLSENIEVYQTVKMISSSITLALNVNKSVYNAISLSKKRKYGNPIRPLLTPRRPKSQQPPRSPRRVIVQSTSTRQPPTTGEYIHTQVRNDSSWRQNL